MCPFKLLFLCQQIQQNSYPPSNCFLKTHCFKPASDIAYVRKCRFKTGNSCYYSVPTLLSARLLSKYLTVKLYKRIILPVVLYDCEILCFTLRKESKLGVFKNRSRVEYLCPRWMRMKRGERSTMSKFLACTVHLI